MHTQMKVQSVLEQSCWEMAVFTYADKANESYEKLKVLEAKHDLNFIESNWIKEHSCNS